MNILIDTNIALYLLGGDNRIAEVLEGQVVHVSFITELELLGYPNISKEEEKVIYDFFVGLRDYRCEQADQGLGRAISQKIWSKTSRCHHCSDSILLRDSPYKCGQGLFGGEGD